MPPSSSPTAPTSTSSSATTVARSMMLSRPSASHPPTSRHSTGRRRRRWRLTCCQTRRLSAGGCSSRIPLTRNSRNCCRKWRHGRGSKSAIEPRLQKQSLQPRLVLANFCRKVKYYIIFSRVL
ncbi:hypothetical protein PR202_ga22406 [Eleusine coracana subsp. coracana]|uniref:Uncharacterized protein n=1 Tax=Eleusine coracana subsp. coracana TaxID=191504 RepID=A0AAV5D321_ELECO|nr:hypothetical protein PR202_ga22406 [Eleusine coracana subsp. coracana]